MSPVVHPAGAPPAAPGSVLPFVLGMVALLLGLVIVALRAQRAEGRALRVCPVCGASAVRAQAAEALRGGLARLHLECGQCGTWRRTVATAAEVETQERALLRDRRRIDADALRLVRSHMRGDLDAFTRTLRRDVVGADDFVARGRR
jgi:ribosomal protein S27AE